MLRVASRAHACTPPPHTHMTVAVCAACSELLVHHALPPDEARSLRTSRVVAPCSYSSHLAGGGISVTSAERVYKPSKRPDTASKSINTHTRIFVDASGAAPAGGQVLMTFFGSARTGE